MRIMRVTTAYIAPILLLFIAGCGGGGGASSDQTPKITTGQMAATVNGTRYTWTGTDAHVPVSTSPFKWIINGTTDVNYTDLKINIYFSESWPSSSPRTYDLGSANKLQVVYQGKYYHSYSGTLTVTSMDDVTTVGTFSAQVREQYNYNDTMTVTAGTFTAL